MAHSISTIFFLTSRVAHSSDLLRPPAGVVDGVSTAGWSCSGIGRRLGADGVADAESGDDAGAAGGVAG